MNEGKMFVLGILIALAIGFLRIVIVRWCVNKSDSIAALRWRCHDLASKHYRGRRYAELIKKCDKQMSFRKLWWRPTDCLYISDVLDNDTYIDLMYGSICLDHARFLSKEDRWKVYDEARRILSDLDRTGIYALGLCYALGVATKQQPWYTGAIRTHIVSTGQIMSLYPEVAIQNPHRDGVYWFPCNRQGYEERQAVLFHAKSYLNVNEGALCGYNKLS